MKDDGWLDCQRRKCSDTLRCMYTMRKPAWKPSLINFAKALSGYISRYANKASRLTGDWYFGQLAVVVGWRAVKTG